jgi:hypothetical protein
MATDSTRNRLARLCWRSIVLALVFATSQLAVTRAAQDDDQQERIKTLIRTLASSNRAPKEGDGETRIPNTYGRTSQERVLNAWAALLKEGIEAFPLLTASTNNKRYSCTVRGPSGDVNLTVGDVCTKIVRNQVAVYSDVIDWPFPGAAPGVFPREELSVWWQTRRGRTLREMQIEATEYALTDLKNPSEHETKLRAQPTINARQMENIRKLEALLNDLKASDRSIQPKTIEGGQRMIGLPGRDTRNSSSHPYKNEEKSANKP